MRLDKFIEKKFNLKSRSYAAQLIKRGLVSVNDCIVRSSSYSVEESDTVNLKAEIEYASFAAHKLKHALDFFDIDIKGLKAIDIGASNGGFCDVMLRAGVDSILAVDVGDCSLETAILESNKVEFRKENARFLEQFEKSAYDFASVDVSFISLELILPTVYRVLKETGEAVVLVKPQFEIGRLALNKKGIVKNNEDALRAVESVKDVAVLLGFDVLGVVIAPKSDEKKNNEYLLYLKKVEQAVNI